MPMYYFVYAKINYRQNEVAEFWIIKKRHEYEYNWPLKR
jgi:hypothetical protein